MAFLGSQTSFLGVDVGTSSLKIVELVGRRKRTELSTYAQADLVNPLIGADEARANAGIQEVAGVLSRMMDQAGVSTDSVVVALPSSVVFSAVIDLPDIPEREMPNAVKFAAQDIVPADLDEMVLGWSRVGEEPHTGNERNELENKDQPGEQANGNKVDMRDANGNSRAPVFITAAPKQIVNRYTTMISSLKLNLLALELETFPLIRSLISQSGKPTLIADLGDKATTFHIFDQGAPRVTHTIDVGGADLTNAIEEKLSVGTEEAEVDKAKYGLTAEASKAQRAAIQEALVEQLQTAGRVAELYQQRSGRLVTHALLIGGGAKLKGLSEYWQQKTNQQASVGNPWKGLAYPDKLEGRLNELGPTYGVAVGLALRGLVEQS